MGLRRLKLKTFGFALILMTVVMVAALGVLYIFLPDYYYWYKNNQLQAGVDHLQSRIESEAGAETAQAIFDFSDTHNAMVVAVDSAGYILLGYSTPFRFMQESGITVFGQNEVRIAISGQIHADANQETLRERIIIRGQNAPGRHAFFLDHATGVTLQREVAHPSISSLIITSTLQPIDEAQAVILSMSPYLLAISFVISMAAAFLFSRQLTPIANLKKEMERTAKLEESKTDFMRAAGHELKTPIAALNGMLEGMLDGVGVYKDHDRYLNECKQQVQRLTVLVHEILLASQAEDIDMAVEEVALLPLAREAFANYETFIEQKGLKVEFAGEEAVINCAKIICNKRKLFEVLSNLASNAVKYSPEGGKITLGMDGSRFFIENECETAAPDERWFEPFFTPDYSRSKHLSGTGLGLYIVKKNLDALQLPFELEAVENGVRFCIEISTGYGVSGRKCKEHIFVRQV